MIKNKQNNRGVNIIDILSASNILTLHNINNKKQLFTKISDVCEKNINTSKSKFLSELLDKEVNENSGIGEGVAIPNIQIDTIKNMFGVFIKLNKPINFNSIDNQPVDIIFTLISPQNYHPTHLNILAFLSRLFTNKKNVKNLRASIDKETIYAILANKL
jgi:PTS system nitrogen regulatory IIA component